MRKIPVDTFWLENSVRLQLFNALKRAIEGDRKVGPYYYPSFNPPDVWYSIYDLVSAELGLPIGSLRNAEDLMSDFILDRGDAHQVLKCVQIAVGFICGNQSAIQHYDHYGPPKYDCVQLITKINTIFTQERVEYQYVEGDFIRTGTDFMYTEVVKPVFRLLSDSRFKTANEEFRAAWERHRANPRDKTALSLANGALETTMKHILKARGVDYRPGIDTSAALIAAIMKTDILKPWQDDHLEGLSNLLVWGAPRVRNKEGSHGPEPDSSPPAPHLIRYGIDLAAATIVMLVEAHLSSPNK